MCRITESDGKTDAETRSHCDDETIFEVPIYIYINMYTHIYIYIYICIAYVDTVACRFRNQMMQDPASHDPLLTTDNSSHNTNPASLHNN